MILPTVTFMTTDSLRVVPRHYQKLDLAMGATRWQTIWRVTLKAARSGIFTAVVFGMARAFGEAWPFRWWSETQPLSQLRDNTCCDLDLCFDHGYSEIPLWEPLTITFSGHWP